MTVTRIEIDLHPAAAATLAEVERDYGLDRAEAIALLIIAGEAELSPGYVDRLLDNLRRGAE